MSEKYLTSKIFPSVEYVEEGWNMSKKDSGELDQSMSEDPQRTEIDRLQYQLTDILEELRPKYRVPFHSGIQRDKSLDEMIEDAMQMNEYQSTTLAFKFFYILSVVIFGFSLQYLRYTGSFLLTYSISSFLVGLFPIKNIIYLPRPTKNICEKFKLMQHFIWNNDISYEDVEEMKNLRKYGNRLISFSVICQLLNYVLVYFILNVSYTIGMRLNSIPLPDVLNYISISNPLSIPLAMILMVICPILLAVGLKMLCFRWIVKNQYSLEIIRLFF